MIHNALAAWSTRFFFAPPDAGGAGGDRGTGDRGGDAGDRGDAGDGVDAGDGGDAGDGDAGDHGDDPDPELEGLGDEYLETERMLDALPPADRDKRIKTRMRRYERKVSELRQLGDIFRGPDGKVLPPAQVARMRERARDAEDIEQFFGEHPDLLQQVLDRRSGKAGTKAGGAADDTFVDPYADESKLWFDTETEAGQKFLAQLRSDARDKWELKQEIKRLKGGLDGVTRETATRQVKEIENTWKNQTLAAAQTAGLTGDLLQAFVTAVYADFTLARAEKRLGKATPAQIIEKHLKLYRRLGSTGRRASAGDAARRVAGNAGRPGTQRRGVATTATDTARKPGTIKDARKSFFDRVKARG